MLIKPIRLALLIWLNTTGVTHVDVKEQRYHQGAGRDEDQIISTGETCRSAQARGTDGTEEVVSVMSSLVHQS